MTPSRILLVLALSAVAVPWTPAEERLKALIIDGQNNHNWKACTPVLKWVLEQSGRFTVDVSTAPDKGMDRMPDAWKAWRPVFKDYAVVVTNYNGTAWPEEVRTSFVDYVSGGGGLTVVHAADNSFPEWPQFNEMIGVGGWGGRNEKSGPMLRWRDGAIVRDESPGAGGTHGKKHEFLVETREAMHPILKGLPAQWRHASDELYAKMRGPARNLTVLATAYAAPEQNGTKEHEPILMVIDYGKGRVFHTVLGHDPVSMSGVGFQSTLCRGSEWAATGTVTLPAPAAGELTGDKAAMRPMPK